MSQEFVSRLADWAIWFKEHEHDGRDMANEIEFMKKSMDGLFECLACAAQDIQDLEGRPREALGKQLWTPGGMAVRGDVRRFG